MGEGTDPMILASRETKIVGNYVVADVSYKMCSATNFKGSTDTWCEISVYLKPIEAADAPREG
jgi:hypothetical protein